MSTNSPQTVHDPSAAVPEQLNTPLVELAVRLEKWRPYLLRIAIDELDSRLRPKVAASDLVQQTLLQAHQHASEFRGDDEETLRRWLRQILLNQMADAADRYHGTAKRRLSAEVAIDADSKVGLRGSLTDGGPSPSEQLQSAEQREAVEVALERLPEDYRQVIELRNRDRLGFEEIGKKLNRSSDAARLLWYRALDRLQQELPSPSP